MFYEGDAGVISPGPGGIAVRLPTAALLVSDVACFCATDPLEDGDKCPPCGLRACQMTHLVINHGILMQRHLPKTLIKAMMSRGQLNLDKPELSEDTCPLFDTIGLK